MMTATLPKIEPATWMLLAGTILVLSVGQVLFKSAATGLQLDAPRTYLSGALVVALLVYALATVMWLVVLSKVPLTVAFPFYGGTFLLVPMLAAAFLGEPLRMQTLLGGAVIMLGVYICSKGAA